MTSDSSEGSPPKCRTSQAHAACPQNSSLPPQQGQPSPTGPQDLMGARASGPAPSQPAPQRTHSTWLGASGYQLLVGLPGRWGGHGCAFPGSRHLYHMRRTWEWEAEGCEPRAAEDPGKKRAPESEPEGWVLAARSERESPTSGGGRCGTGSGRFSREAGGGPGRSPAATSSPLLPPPTPPTALQVRLLT